MSFKVGEHGKMVEMFAECERCHLQYKIVYEDGSELCTYCGKCYDSKQSIIEETTEEKQERLEWEDEK